MTAGGRVADVLDVLRGVEAWGHERGWRGSDPYDGLNATRLAGPLRSRPRTRQALTQLVKRSPLDLRPALGIPGGRNAAAIANVVSAYARNGFLPDAEARGKLERALLALDELRVAGYEEPCWGYHFDVQTRVFFYPASSPNTIATSFAGFALLDAHEATGDSRLLALAEGAGDFLLRHVPQTSGEGGAYFGYLPGDRTPIHNANLLVCALLARLHALTGREDFLGAAQAGIGYSVAHQRPDGSWPYAERRGLEWVDGYHTGYVLESLLACAEAGVDAEQTAALEKGLRYYRKALFLDDGTPKFLDSALYPIDVQCAAQGIQTFARSRSFDAAYADFAWRVFEYARAHLRRSDGAFVYQRRRLWANRTPHVRWAAAPMMLALTYLLETDGSEP